jgi:hypothetical protein
MKQLIKLNKMYTPFKAIQITERFQLLLLVMLIFCGVSVKGQISVPGTGRTTLSGTEPTWRVYGFWSTMGEVNGAFSGDPVRIPDPAQPCISVADHMICDTLTAPDPNDPPSGGATVYFSYDFQVVQTGTYSTNDLYISDATVDVEIVRNNGDFNKDIIVFQNGHASCVPYNLTATLTPGNYEVRITTFGNLGNPADLWVMTTGGGNGSCVPAVTVDNLTNKTIQSGQSPNILLSASVTSNFTWTASNNPNVQLGSSTNSGNTIIQTITNLTSQTQSVTYTVTPTSVNGSCTGLPKTVTVFVTAACTNGCDSISCTDCIGSFAPDIGATYLISAWVQQANSTDEMSYDGPRLGVDFTGGTTPYVFETNGPIIDGWQRIDGSFTVSSTATEVFVRLINNGSKEVYFDDLRIHPLKASFKSFVYDPVSMRLMAELDENNYATFYEYDEEGALIRVKKETERGIKTIKETGNNTRKQ